MVSGVQIASKTRKQCYLTIYIFKYLIYFYDVVRLLRIKQSVHIICMQHVTFNWLQISFKVNNTKYFSAIWLILSLACNVTHFYIFVISTQFTSFHDNLIIVQQHIHFLKVFDPLNPYRFKAILKIIIIVEWNEGHCTLLKLTMGLLKPTMTSNGY